MGPSGNKVARITEFFNIWVVVSYNIRKDGLIVLWKIHSELPLFRHA